jgi:3' terminal RNA ribose 2'-O-methyltransferase Hen1
MLLTLTTTHRPATDLGYLLVKNPARVQSFELPFGAAHVFYPEAREERCTAALLLDVDPVALVRGRKGPEGEGGLLRQYVNDRPYVASSFMSVALADVLKSAMTGASKDRPELAAAPIPLEARIAVLPCRGGEELLRRLFEPLGYRVSAERITGGEGEEIGRDYFAVTLAAECRLADLLTHLYVLIPVLDNEKHYWVGEQEMEKLLRRGEGWLPAHPERELIARRYLRHRTSLVREAIARLAEGDAPEVEEEETETPPAAEEESVEKRIGLNTLRHQAVVEALTECGAAKVLDLGCGEGRLLQRLLAVRAFRRIVGVDASYRCLEIARDRLRLDRMPPMRRERIELLHGGLTYRDRRLEGFDAAAVVEVIEHLDPARLAAFERVVFEAARPGRVVVTTPNAEYNVMWKSLPGGAFRHRDHRFEWTRAEFQAWAQGVAERFGYAVAFRPVGPEEAALGAPTQMAVFDREGGSG